MVIKLKNMPNDLSHNINSKKEGQINKKNFKLAKELCHLNQIY